MVANPGIVVVPGIIMATISTFCVFLASHCIIAQCYILSILVIVLDITEM